MKLWEIKAESLRLMFADSDLDFNEDDFSGEVVYNNPNTREKLIRMEDSIRRAIDLYYQYNGEIPKVMDKSLVKENDKYENIIDFSEDNDFGYPTRIDIKESNKTRKRENVPFMFDKVSKRVFFIDVDYASMGEDLEFLVFYKMGRLNLPNSVDEMTYDLDELYIPEDIQRNIPHYVKSELFEEDEPSIANNARNTYIQFLVLNQRKMFGKARSKVTRRFPWGSE